MTIKKRTVEGLTSGGTSDTLGPGGTAGAVGLGAKYAKLVGIRAANYATSAKASGGTSTTQKIKITDNNSDVVYLDAAARNLTTQVTLYPSADDTATGLGIAAVDATGAAATAGAGAPIIMESPVTVAVLEGEVATDYVQVQLIVEV